MTFEQHHLHLLKEWRPSRFNFRPEEDRLLVTTNWGGAFLLKWSSDRDDEGKVMLDPDHLPENFAEIPGLLRTFRGITAEVEGDNPWRVYAYDGELTSSGPQLEFEALGAGWTWPIHTSLGFENIAAVSLSSINLDYVTQPLDGVCIKTNRLNVLSTAVTA